MAEKTSPAATTEQAGKEKKGAKAGREGGKEMKLEDFILSVHRLSTLLADTDIFSKHGVSIAEWATLKAIGNGADVSLMKLSRSAGVSRQRLQTILADLERKGLVASSQSKDGDKRTRTIAPSPKSAEVLAAIAGEFNVLAGKVPSLGKTTGKRLTSSVRFAAKLGHAMPRATRERSREKAGARREGGAARKAEKAGKRAERNRGSAGRVAKA